MPSPERPGLGLLAVMGQPRGGEEEPIAPDDEVVPGPSSDVPEPQVVAAAEVRGAFRGGSDEEFARALARFVRVLRVEE